MALTIDKEGAGRARGHNRRSMEQYLAQAYELHRRFPVIDGHADSILMVMDGLRTLTGRSDQGHIDIPRAREAGVACTVQALWPGVEYLKLLPGEVRTHIDGMHRHPVRRAAEAADCLLGQLEQAEGVAVHALTAADIRRAHVDGTVAVLINIEGGEALGGELALLRNYYRVGVRMLGLVWNYRNELADGVSEESAGGGLSRFGREVVKEMNRLGMLIDLSHITPAGFHEVLELSADPVLFTHGNCRALHDHRRNLTDGQIRVLAEQGGVFGISFVASFMGKETATLRTVADHIDHVVQLLGSADHVALGSDFDGATTPPGLEDITRLPGLTAELLRRGYSDADMGKILGGNYLRVFEQVLRG